MCGNIKITRENKGVHHNVYIQRNQRNLPIRHHRNRFIQRLSGAYTEKIGELNPKEVQSWENSDTDNIGSDSCSSSCGILRYWKRRREKALKTVRVAAAVIKAVNEKNETVIFTTQRGYGEFKDGWEFPGGKIEEGESPQQALKREIAEELDAEIRVGDLVGTIEYDYPSFHLSMDCFWGELVSGKWMLKEHEAARWLTKEELDQVEWLPADIALIDRIRAEI